MGPQNKVVALLLAVVLACTSFAVSAKQVDTSLSANPTATISAIDSIGTPLSNQVASEVRGEALPLVVIASLSYIYYLGVVYGLPYAYNYAAGLTNGTWILTQSMWQEVKQIFGW